MNVTSEQYKHLCNNEVKLNGEWGIMDHVNVTFYTLGR